ncbi:hypothetical protein SANTM175S_10804 [Streptomyces antimycoticus]
MGRESGRGIGRRTVLQGSAAASAALAVPAVASAASAASGAPAQALSGRPSAQWGVQVGDVTTSSGLVWVRSDRPARMIVETSATESFARAKRWRGPLVGPGTDFTGRTALHGLPAGSQVHYRVLLADPEDPRRTSEAVHGTLRAKGFEERAEHPYDAVEVVGDAVGQCVRRPEAGQIHGDHLALDREDVQHGLPRLPVVADAVQQHQRPPRAAPFVHDPGGAGAAGGGDGEGEGRGHGMAPRDRRSGRRGCGV